MQRVTDNDVQGQYPDAWRSAQNAFGRNASAVDRATSVARACLYILKAIFRHHRKIKQLEQRFAALEEEKK